MRRNTNRKKSRTKTNRKTHRKTHRRSQKGGKDPTVIPGIKKDYEFAEISTIADTDIYQVRLDNCYKYFAKEPKRNYVIIKTSENEHIIFNFDSASDDIPMLAMLKQKIKYYNASYTTFLSENKIQQIPDLPCKSKLSLDRAKSKISELNTALKTNCTGLELNLDYLYSLKGQVPMLSMFDPKNANTMNYLILCLYDTTTQNCISSIEILFDGPAITINSKTVQQHEGKKYNKLLRSIVILIAKDLNSQTEHITSDATNPKSAWLLLHHFGARISENQPDLLARYNMATDETAKKRLLGNFLQRAGNYITLHVDLTPDNIAKAQQIFDELMRNRETGIQCSPASSIVSYLNPLSYF